MNNGGFKARMATEFIISLTMNNEKILIAQNRKLLKT